jgi:hypothetical protein
LAGWQTGEAGGRAGWQTSRRTGLSGQAQRGMLGQRECRVQRAACSDAATKDKRTERQVPTGQAGGTSPKSVVLEPAPLQLRVASPAPAARRATPSDPPHAQGGPAVVAAAATALVAAVAAVATATAPYSSAECPPLVYPSACLSMSSTGSLAAARQTHPPAWKPSPPARSRLLPAATLHANIRGRPGESRPHVETGGPRWSLFQPSWPPPALGPFQAQSNGHGHGI